MIGWFTAFESISIWYALNSRVSLYLLYKKLILYFSYLLGKNFILPDNSFIETQNCLKLKHHYAIFFYFLESQET